MFIPILQMRNLRSAWLQSLGEKSLFWVFHSGERKNYKILLSFPIPLWRADSMEKTLMLGKNKGRGEGDNRGWDGWMASLTQRTWVWANSGSWWRTGKPGVHGVATSQTRLSDWTTTPSPAPIYKTISLKAAGSSLGWQRTAIFCPSKWGLV